MEIKITSSHANAIAAKLRTAIQPAVKRGMKKVGDLYKSFIIRRFRSQPPEWKPKKRDDGKPILVDTGQLRRDVGRLNVQIRGNTVKASVRNSYAQYHQFGTSKMPKRTILIKPPKVMLKKMLQILQNELAKNLK